MCGLFSRQPEARVLRRGLVYDRIMSGDLDVIRELEDLVGYEFEEIPFDDLVEAGAEAGGRLLYAVEEDRVVALSIVLLAFKSQRSVLDYFPEPILKLSNKLSRLLKQKRVSQL